MAVTYGFYNSMGGDRKYSAEQMSSIFDGVIVDGVYAGIGNKLTVSAGTGLQVLVKSGRAWFNHTWTLNDADYPLAIAAPDKSLKRIDRVVLEIDARNEARVNTFKVVKGTPNSNPQPPAVTNTDQIHQHILAEVTVDANATSIPVGNIKQIVGTAATPFVTSVLQQTNIDVLYNEWRGKFDAWFSNVQAQLAGNVATNLQKQIDQTNTNITTQINSVKGMFASYVPTANKASTVDVTAGTNDTKWVTPKAIADKVKSAALGKPTLLGTYSGSVVLGKHYGNYTNDAVAFLTQIIPITNMVPVIILEKVYLRGSTGNISSALTDVLVCGYGGQTILYNSNTLPTTDKLVCMVEHVMRQDSIRNISDWISTWSNGATDPHEAVYSQPSTKSFYLTIKEKTTKYNNSSGITLYVKVEVYQIPLM